MEISYQPVLNLQTRRIVKCEAPCRPPEAGIDLGAFVVSAEINGSLRDYTNRVFDSVFGDWQRHGADDIDLSVNLTVADLAERDICKRVEKACRKHRFDPKRLWFEVDDRVQAMVDPESLEHIATLASMGVRFSIDSFGDDLSQATHYELQRLRFSEVKIDGRYVRDADENMNHRNAIASIVAMGRDLRIDVAVKSVERESIASLMIRLGVTNAQGYYFARPIDAMTVETLVERMRSQGPLPTSR